MARPTHFLSIPLGQTHPTLRARVADFHAALNLSAPDSTLLAGPQRVHLTLGIMNLTWPTLRATSIPPSAFLHPLRALVLILGVMILTPDSLPTAPHSVDCLDPLASINNLPPVQPSVSPTSLPSARIHPSPPRAPFSFPPHAPLFQALGQAISTRANPRVASARAPLRRPRFSAYRLCELVSTESRI
ncbi:hypothetical protein IW261DRAFT_696947 [Armillaria novae-zelandiae]|uniref:A-kinase anchor protein 7-like phosphoesterase domain-containing protein n=1 Tax=Armillaria novae-zelandiae TaxID=153914 RepID=A0AA39UCB1_9AGAR|nr:hypothetical protein IW261DRAFT_696947 [Armillaria novae-zelandiae]